MHKNRDSPHDSKSVLECKKKTMFRVFIGSIMLMPPVPFTVCRHATVRSSSNKAAVVSVFFVFLFNLNYFCETNVK